MKCIVYILALVVSFANAKIEIKTSAQISVSSGQRTILRKTDISVLRTLPNLYCRIKVTSNEESLQSSIVRVFPIDFPCDYVEGSVYLEHYGLPVLNYTSVGLVITHATEDSQRISTPVLLNIVVAQSFTNNIVSRNQGLTVQEISDYSRPISSSNLGFTYSGSSQECHVSLHNTGSAYSWPRFVPINLLYNKSYSWPRFVLVKQNSLH